MNLSPRAAGLALLLALAAGSVASCGEVDGGSAHAGARAYVPTDRSYRLWYLVPPWRFVSSTAQTAVLQVAVGADDPRSGGALREVIGLTIETVAGVTPDAALAARVQAGVASGAVITLGPRRVALADGASGVEAAFGDRFVLKRVAAAALADGRTVVFTFSAGSSLDNDADVTAMLAAFEPHPPVGP